MSGSLRWENGADATVTVKKSKLPVTHRFLLPLESWGDLQRERGRGRRRRRRRKKRRRRRYSAKSEEELAFFIEWLWEEKTV